MNFAGVKFTICNKNICTHIKKEAENAVGGGSVGEEESWAHCEVKQQKSEKSEKSFLFSV